MTIPKTTHGTILAEGTPEYDAAIRRIEAAAAAATTNTESSN